MVCVRYSQLSVGIGVGDYDLGDIERRVGMQDDTIGGGESFNGDCGLTSVG